MKLRYNLFLIVFFLSFSSLYAQTAPQSSIYAKNIIEYQWPHDGDSYVPQRTTFIMRPTKQIMQNRSVSNFSFEVYGGVSGTHTGTVLISDDNQTVIFKPDQPFALNENVSVKFVISGIETITGASFNFRITALSEEEQGKALNLLQEREQANNEAVMPEPPLNIKAASLPLATDTVSGLPVVVVIDTANVHAEGNIFFSPTGKLPSPYSFLAIVSDTGTTALFERNIPIGCGNFRMQPDGTITYFRQYYSPTGGVFAGRIDHLDRFMNLIDTFQCVGYTADLHDFNILPNGHSLLVAYDPERVNMRQYLDTVQHGAYSQFAANAAQNALVFGAIIQELDQQKNLVFQWRSWDHFQITDAQRDIDITLAKPIDSLIDYMHINAAIVDPKDGNIIASFRHCDEVSKISRKDTSFIWRWGGKHNMFSFSGINPNDTLQFSHQHDPERIANGHITVFDNGNLHTKIVGGTATTVPSTRAVEYDLDEIAHTAKVVWEYDSLPYCAAAGNVQRLDNGNTMIGLGIVTQPSAVEVTNDGKKVFQLSIQTGAFSYRTYRFPFAPQSSVRQTGNPGSFGISAINPNPAQDQTKISFSVLSPGMMEINLLDVLGKPVRTIKGYITTAGIYTSNLDLRDITAGTYYCKFSQNGNATIKMIVVQK